MASKQRKIGAIIALDGEQAFKKSVTECNKALTTMKSEMKLVTAETSGNANSLDSLKKKHEVLQNTLAATVKKEEAVQSGLDHAQQDYKRVGDKLDEYKKKLADAQTELKSMETAQGASSDAIEEQKRVIADLEGNVESIEKVYDSAGNRVQDWETKLNNAKAETIKATQALKENDTYMDEAARSTDQCATSIDNFGNKTTKVKTDVADLGNVIKVNLIDTLVDAGKSLAKNAFDSAIEGATSLQEATAQLAASTGTSTEAMEQYSDVMQEIYKDNYGESLEEIADVMSKIKQYTDETDPTVLKSMTENALTLSDTFNIDVNEGLRAVTEMMEDFGLTADEAYNYIAKGAQNGLNKSDELADNIAEYGSLWSQAGFSAEEMFSIMENGLESGAYNLDKVNDFVKEFGISLSDGRIEEHLGSFSDETATLFEAWKNGEATTKDVFNSVINDLASMSTEQEALTLASDTWSALGEDNSMKVITSLNKANDAYKDVAGTMESIKDIKYDTVASDWESLGRTFQTEIAGPIAEDFFPIAETGIKVLSDNLDTILPLVAGIGTAFAAKKGIDYFSGIASSVVSFTTELVASTAATEGASTAMTVLNAVMSANPAMLVATAIGAVTTAVILFGGESETAKTKVQELSDAADSINTSALSAADELNEATAAISSSMEGSAVSGETAHRLVDELQDLASKSALTSTEQSRMSTIVGELNTMFPEMSLSIDDATGSLSMGIDEIKKYIDTAVDMGKIEAVQKAVSEATEKLVDAEIERTRAEDQLKETNDALTEIQNKRTEAEEAVREKNEALKDAQDAYNEAVASGKGNLDELYAATLDNSEAQIEYEGQLMSVTAAYEKMAQDENALIDTQSSQQAALDTLNESIAAGQEEIDTYTQYLQDNTTVAQENTDTTTANTDTLNANTEATAANADATASNTEAAQANAEANAAQTEAAQAAADQITAQYEAYNNLSEAQQTLAVDVTNAVLTMQESVQDALESQMNMFEEFDGGVEVSSQTLLDNMQSQIDGVTNWEQQLSELVDQGINQDLLQALIDMGPEGASYVTAFNNMTKEELDKANELWGQSVDIKSMTNDWGEELKQGVGELAAGSTEAWNELAQSMNQSANESGEYVVDGLVTGMQNAQSKATEEGKDLGVKTVDSIDSGAGVASPSKKTKQTGQYLVDGLVNGVKAKRSTAINTAKTLGSDVANAVKTGIQSRESAMKSTASSVGSQTVSSLQSGMRSRLSGATETAASMGSSVGSSLSRGLSAQQSSVASAAGSLARSASSAISANSSSSSAYYAGYNMAIGMANGISSGSSSVIRAASNMAASAIRSAKSALGIHSPSKVFQEIGSFAAQGFPIGFESQEDNVTRTVKDSMESISKSALSGVEWGDGLTVGTTDSGRSGANGLGDITLEIPMYVNGVLTETQVEKISLNTLNKTQRKINASKGVRSFAIA